MRKSTLRLAFAGVIAAMLPHSLAAQELVVSSFGGAWTDNHREFVIEPFEKEYGVTVRVVTGYSSDIMAQLQAQKDNPQMDVVHFSGGQEAVAAAEGLLAPITEAEVPNLADLYPIAKENIAKGEGPAFSAAAIGLLYNSEEVADAPTSWKDLWKDEFEGEVLLTDISNSYGLLGMLMINKVYGGSLDDIEPGLEKIGELLDDGDEVVRSSTEVRQLFAQGDVLIGPYANDHAYRLKADGAPIVFVTPEEGAAASFLTVNLVAGRPEANKDLALKFIDYTLRPEVMAKWAEAARYSPMSPKTELPADVAADVVYGEDQIAKLVAFDAAKVGEEKSKWIDAWNKLLAQ